jgi:hypothetical protein
MLRTLTLVAFPDGPLDILEDGQLTRRAPAP